MILQVERLILKAAVGGMRRKPDAKWRFARFQADGELLPIWRRGSRASMAVFRLIDTSGPHRR